MSIIHLFHGTSYNNYTNIKNNGFSDYKETVWSCSNKEKTYFYHMDNLCEAEGFNAESLEEKIDFCLSRANESAQITAAIDQEINTMTVVFEIIVDSNYVEDFMENDDSCENMYGCVQINSLLINKLIKGGKATATVHFFKFNPKLSLFYLTGIIDNDYFEDSLYKLDCTEREFIQQIRDARIFVDDIYYGEKIKTEPFII